MNENPAPAEETLEIDLRKPGLAAFLAWIWPGAGHLYQRRYAKGLLFMVCVLGTYFFGLGISGGRAVYASWSRQDFRWQYICQLGVGAPALPAVVQERLTADGKRDPLFPLCYRSPRTLRDSADNILVDSAGRPMHAFTVIELEEIDKLEQLSPQQRQILRESLIVDGFMAPPQPPVDENRPDVLAAWHEEFPTTFEMGTLFTMIAGLLNLLAIYDAYAGPVIAVPEDEADKDKSRGNGDGEKKDGA
jgi:hypothetical protein